MAEKTLVEQFQEALQNETEKRKDKKPGSLLETYYDLLNRGIIKERGSMLKGIGDTRFNPKVTTIPVG